jgi:hypothetical protein
MNDQEEQEFVIGLVDRMQAVIAGVDIARAHTAVSLMVAATIISTSDDTKTREHAYRAFCEQVRTLMTPEWVEFIRARTRPITLKAPERRQ